MSNSYIGNQPSDVPLTSEQLEPNIVNTQNIVNLAVTTAKIADDAVTGAKLANNIDIAGTLV